MGTKVSNFEIGKSYSFDTYAPQVLQLHVNNVKVLSIMDAATASRSGLDIHAMHERVRPYLPAGFNKDPNTQVYVKLRGYSEKETIYSLSWINLDTLMELEAKTIVATIGDVGMEDLEVIRRLLAINGYTNIELKLVE